MNADTSSSSVNVPACRRCGEAAYRGCRYLEVFGVHGVLQGIVRLDGKKGARTHMQRHLFGAYSFPAQSLYQFRGEVQTGRRGGYGAFETGVDGLIGTRPVPRKHVRSRPGRAVRGRRPPRVRRWVCA